MLCQQCKKNVATKNKSVIINGISFESHLCDKCYAEAYGGLDYGANLWAGLFATASEQIKECPVCHTTYSDYERTGLFGCASCYDVFKEEITPSLIKMHGKACHVGKVGTNKDDLGLHRRLNALKEQLEVAMREKRYADAGALNRRINEISKKIYGGKNDE